MSHLAGGLLRVNYRLAAGRADYVVVDDGRRLMSLLINAQVVHLQPETDSLAALENNRLAVGTRDAWTHVGVTNHEATPAHLSSRDGFHAIGHNERRSG